MTDLGVLQLLCPGGACSVCGFILALVSVMSMLQWQADKERQHLRHRAPNAECQQRCRRQNTFNLVSIPAGISGSAPPTCSVLSCAMSANKVVHAAAERSTPGACMDHLHGGSSVTSKGSWSNMAGPHLHAVLAKSPRHVRAPAP